VCTETNAHSVAGQARKALVIGATGGIGGEMTRILLHRGWQVTALHRSPETAVLRQPDLTQLRWMKGDAMRAADVLRAADGADLIVHAANPPGYRDWDLVARPMLRHAMDAAKACSARLLFPGTLYNFAKDAPIVVDETTPQRAQTRKGLIRVAMEEMLRDAAGDGLRSLIVRAGDFFGPRPGNNWFSQCLVKPGQPLRKVTYPGLSGIGHSWAYLPDLAETMMRLVERERDLGPFDVFHFAGHWLPDSASLMAALRTAGGNAAIGQRRFFWPGIYLAAPFVTLCREMLEMRYLWQRDLQLENGKLLGFLGGEPRTDLHEALRSTLAGLGCLPVEAASSAR